MAKANMLSQIVMLCYVGWLKSRNIARASGDYGNSDELLKSFTERGWTQDADGTVIVESLDNLDPSVKAELIAQLQEKWDNLKSLAASDSGKLIDLKVFEDTHVDSRGRLIEPLYVGVTGHRRSSVVFQANVQRRKTNPPLGLITEVPVIIRHYASATDRLAEQIGENHFKSLGAVMPSDKDNLRAAMRLYQLGETQAKLRQVFKDGVGQKLFGILELNKRWPELRIYDRMLLEPNDDGFLNMKSAHYKDLPTLVLRSTPEALAKKNESLIIAGKEPLKAATQDDIAAYFGSTTKEKSGNAQKVLKGEVIRGLADNSPNAMVRRVCNAIALADTDLISPLNMIAPGVNALMAMVDAGDYPGVEAILLKLASSNVSRMAKINEILNILG